MAETSSGAAKPKLLALAKDVIERREAAAKSPDSTILQLNGKQSTRLWQTIRIVFDYLSTSSSTSLDVHEGVNHCHTFPSIVKEFYVVVTRADAIKQHFNADRPWLEAAVLQGNNRKAFKELHNDLQVCVESLQEIGLGQDWIVSPLTAEDMDGDYQADVENFRTAVRKWLVGYDSGEDETTRLAKYLLDREEKTSNTDREEKDLLQFYRDMSDHPSPIDEYIGKGSFGAVHKAKWLGMNCAKKHFDGDISIPDDEKANKQEFMREVGVLAKSNHPHILKLLCLSLKPCYFVSEIMPTDLEKFYFERWRTRKPGEAFTLQAAIDIMLQMARGMEYLHEHDIVHRDLKSSNILVAPSEAAVLRDEGYADVKLADFGLTKTLVSDLTNPTRHKMGTTRWRAPEAFDMAKEIDWKKADVYSFAITCSEILTGKQPFNSFRLTNLLEHLTRGERPDLPETCPKRLASLLKACWHNDPNVRPPFSVIRKKLTTLKKQDILLGGSKQDPEKSFVEEWGSEETMVQVPVDAAVIAIEGIKGRGDRGCIPPEWVRVAGLRHQQSILEALAKSLATTVSDVVNLVVPAGVVSAYFTYNSTTAASGSAPSLDDGATDTTPASASAPLLDDGATDATPASALPHISDSEG